MKDLILLTKRTIPSDREPIDKSRPESGSITETSEENKIIFESVALTALLVSFLV